MPNTNLPEYLYYYTDVDTLALILKNHTIRLNSLDKMDDKQEQMSTDLQNFGKFVFVSCWTEEQIESIPMWRMYTPKGKGVRLKLRSNPFVAYDVDVLNFAKNIGAQSVQGSGQLDFKLIVPTEKLLDKNYAVSNYTHNSQLLNIEYTNDNNLLNPDVMYTTEEGTIVELGKLGKYKNLYWKFQKEWRYRLLIFPISINRYLQRNYSELIKFVSEAQKGISALPFDYYDLVIRDECFEDMSIMLAPDITESSKTFVNLLVQEYNPSCELISSDLTSLI